MKKYIKLCIAVIVNYLFWRGVYDNVINVLPNACEMTYMYEYPEYIEVNVQNNYVSSYRLYVYGEGHYARLLSKKIYKGIPVLFIPGNQGSSKQVRSLGSVAYRMFQKYSTQFQFNYFAVDFNEEIGALFGPVLDRQTQFVGLAIKTILNLYANDTNRPQSVILVGHSMGGLVARAVVSLPDVPSNWVSIIITEATPHIRPVVSLDSWLLEFSEQTNAYWEKERHSKLRNIVFVTIGGGKSDIQVPSLLTTSQFADIDETLLSVPMCWLTTDHLAIVWCRQLVLAINRGLFNSVDKSTRQISTDIRRIIRAFKGQLSQRVEEDISFQVMKQRIGSNGIRMSDMIELKDLQFVRRLKRSKEQFFVIPLRDGTKGRHLTAVMEHVGPKSFVMACNAVNNSGNLIIDSGEGLQHYARSIPGNRKEVNINLSTLEAKNYTHVVAFVQATNEQTTLSLDLIVEDSPTATIVAPAFMSSFTPISVVKSFSKKSLALNISIEGFTEFWQSFTLRLTPDGHCSSDGSRPAVSIRSSWVNRWEYIICRNNDTFDCILELDIPSPVAGEGIVEVHVVKPPLCSYSLSLQKNLGGIFERIALLFVSQIPTFAVCHLLLILANQYKAVSNGSKTSFFIHFGDISPISVVPFMKLFAVILNWFAIETDKAYLDNARTNIEVLPIVLFVSAMPITLIFSLLFKTLLYGLSYGLHRWTRWPREDTHTSNSSLGLFSISSFLVVLLLAVGASTCGAVALTAASILYFMKVLKMNVSKHGRTKHLSNDNYIKPSDTSHNHELASRRSISEDIVPSSINSSDHNSSSSLSAEDNVPEHNSVDKDSASPSTTTEKASPEKKVTDVEELSTDIHFTLMMLTFAVALLNLPSLIAWIKNLSFEQHLSSDPSFLPNCCILSSLFVLWQIQNFKPTRKFYGVGNALHVNCILMILFGSVLLFRVSEIVSYSFIVISLHQLFASK